MKYMLLINAGELDASGGAVGCEPEDWMRFDKEINDSGVVVASESLADLVTATRVQVANDGKRTVTDGPFAETREVLGGFFGIDGRTSFASAGGFMRTVPEVDFAAPAAGARSAASLAEMEAGEVLLPV